MWFMLVGLLVGLGYGFYSACREMDRPAFQISDGIVHVVTAKWIFMKTTVCSMVIGLGVDVLVSFT